MKDLIIETGITIDHEAGTCRVDTTHEGTAKKLARDGWQEIADGRSAPYRSFIGKPKDIGFRSPNRKKRAGNPAGLEAARARRSATAGGR